MDYMDKAHRHNDANMLSTRYLRHSKSVAILWAVFSLCSAILNAVVFLSEEWAGATPTSASPGHFGIWKFCTVTAGSARLDPRAGVTYTSDVRCTGSLENFSSILNPAFRASTVFVGLAVLMSVVCLVAIALLFCFIRARSAFEICGTMQILEGICMAIGVLCFPAGWDNGEVRSVCGNQADDFALGTCEIRWAYMLAFVCLIDAFFLSFLAFILSNRDAKPITLIYSPPHYTKGEFNSGFIGDGGHSLAGSRKSLAMSQPVLMIPQPPATPGGTLPPPEQYSDGTGYGVANYGHFQL